jgi:hypothetical protein
LSTTITLCCGFNTWGDGMQMEALQAVQSASHVQPAAGLVQPPVPRPERVKQPASLPGAVQPLAPQPGAVQPSAPQPGLVQPPAPQPGLAQPAAPRPAPHGQSQVWQANLARLAGLGEVLAQHGLRTRLITPPGRVPSLHVVNPQASALAEDVYAGRAQDGLWWFWWSWAERITVGEDLEGAASRIKRVLAAS